MLVGMRRWKDFLVEWEVIKLLSWVDMRRGQEATKAINLKRPSQLFQFPNRGQRFSHPSVAITS